MSVRLHQKVMERVRAHLERDKKANLTEFLERGALLALCEAEKLPPEYETARMALHDGGVELDRDVTAIWAWRYLPECRKLTKLEACIREFLLSGLESVSEWPGYEEAMRALTEHGK